MTNSERNHQDSKVLLVGVICAMLIFTVVTVFETSPAVATIHIDLVLAR